MDIVIQIIFFVIAALIVGASAMVVTVRNIIHAALWLISSFFGVGMLYLLMEAEFLAISQVLVYVGAVSVLVLFAIMLTRQIANEAQRQLYQRWWLSLLVCVVLFGVVLVPTLAEEQWFTVAETGPIAGTVELGVGFMQEYLLPFQVAAVLLLAALVGAIVIALEERARRRPVLTLAERLRLRQQQEQQQALSSEATDESTPDGREAETP